MRFNPDEYITVAERIEKFYARFPDGRLLTSIVEHNQETGFILCRAEAYREKDDALPAATGHAYELRSAGHVQAGSYVEVCETPSVGRALALLGFEVKRGVASREEVVRGQQKAQARPRQDADGTLDAQILTAAEALGYDAAKVKKWVNQKYEVTTGLAGLTDHDKRKVLEW
ncbi:MAG TPA: hypothetical protein VF297_05340 [Pyrinomonadaceae bacterium]